MGDFWLDFGLSIVFTALRAAVKNPKQKARIKKAMLKLRDLIDSTYGQDAE